MQRWREEGWSQWQAKYMPALLVTQGVVHEAVEDCKKGRMRPMGLCVHPEGPRSVRLYVVVVPCCLQECGSTACCCCQHGCVITPTCDPSVVCVVFLYGRMVALPW